MAIKVYEQQRFGILKIEDERVSRIEILPASAMTTLPGVRRTTKKRPRNKHIAKTWPAGGD